MSILSKASLVQIPSGYGEDKLYSEVPNTTAGDFQFSRASSGTRVSSDGYIETAGVLSATELVTNGDFATDSDWNKGNKWTISGGTANKATGSTSNISQVISGISGKKIQVTFTISNQSGSGGLGASANGSDYTQNSTNGTYTEYIIPTSDNLYIRASYSFVCSIDNVSVKEVAQNNVPRLDYSGGASCPTLLLEGQRTNKSNNSEDWTASGYVKNNVTVTANQTTSPDGTENADQLDFGSGSGFFYENVTTITAASTYSVFVKYIDYQYIQIIGTGDVDHYANFDIQNGIVGNTGSQSTASIEDYGNGWYRCIINYNSGTFAGGARVYKTTSLTAGWASGGGVAGSFYFWGNQMELGTFHTSYIPTSGTSVTRTLESGIITSATDLIGQTEGTLYSEFDLTEDNNFTIVEINLGNSTSNRILAYRNASYIQFIVQVGGTVEINNPTLVTFLDTNKIAVTYQTDDFKIYLNGSLVKTYTSGNIPSGFDTIDLQDNNLQGRKQGVKSFAIFKEILTSTELETLTTI